jgi:putative hydrolase of the HAD superfamily
MNAYTTKSFQEVYHLLNQKEFASKEHVLLDLDNTLHDFYHSAGIAKETVFDYMSDTFPLFQKTLAEQYYRELIISDSHDGFTANRTSDYFRTRRFTKLLAYFNIEASDFIRDKVLPLYEVTLIKNLKPYKGALDFVNYLSSTGRVVYIVTEGPYDAQERVLKQLGMLSKVEKLYTSGQMNAPKHTGELFIKVITDANISANQSLVIGDNMERDIVGAQIADIAAICLQHS